MIDLPGATSALRDLATRGAVHDYKKGRLLIEEGDVGDTLHIIVKGRLRVFSVDANSGREITYDTYGPGEYVGEMSLDGGRRAANVEVIERSTCITITRATLEAFIGERPEFAFELLAKVIARARVATLSARQMALNSVYGRLKWLLETEGADGVAVAMTHNEMAARIGCTRPMVSKLMKELVDEGYVEAARHGYRVLKPLKLHW